MLFVANEIFLFEFGSNMLKVKINVEILKKTAMTKLSQKGTMGWNGCADPMSAEIDVDVGDCPKMCD